jgi:quinoprotein glucose dehydrogenase
MKQYRMGPLFTPPSIRGTLMRPGIIGGANWGGGAFDPDTGMLYVKSTNVPSIARLQKPKLPEIQSAAFVMVPTAPYFHRGIPLTKPPYGHLTAIDLNQGEIVWRVPFGDDAQLRANPALKDVQLPEHLGSSGASGAIVTKGGLIFCAGGDTAIYALDTADGRYLWTFPLGRRTNATPMTYTAPSGRQMLVIASGMGSDAAVTAFALQ